jgi:hypothetical protein
MSERLRVAILTGCLFVIGLHFEQSAKLLLEVWRGPYAGGAVTPPLAVAPEARPYQVAPAARSNQFAPAARPVEFAPPPSLEGAEWLARASRDGR